MEKIPPSIVLENTTLSVFPPMPSLFACLPPKVGAHFKQVYHISDLLPWQIECLTKLKGTMENTWQNIVIRAPTGAGKSLVSDILTVYTLLVNQVHSKAVYVVPYVSLLSEKYDKLVKLSEPLGLSVVSLLGNRSYQLFDIADIVLCTIEKANNLIYALIESQSLSKISIIVLDEVQFVGDEQRGALLETLVAKILFSQKIASSETRIVAISATIDNFEDFTKWLKAKPYECDKATIKIDEYIKAGSRIFNNCGKLITTVKEKPHDKYKVTSLIEREISKGPILLFSPSKAFCEDISSFLSNSRTANRTPLETIKNLLDKSQLTEARITNKVQWLAKGVACHHAGMTAEERSFIETLYKESLINTLVCTSTLAAGVNLPAATVIIIGLTQGLSQISVSTYKQMKGRAGRLTKGFAGQCYLLCKDTELQQALKMVKSVDRKNPVWSTLGKNKSAFRRLLLEGIALGYCARKDELEQYIGVTFLMENGLMEKRLLEDAIRFLTEYELIEGEEKINPTRLGATIAKTGQQVEEMLLAYFDLQSAYARLLPCNKAFAVYLITPIFLSSDNKINWNAYLSYYIHHLYNDEDMKKTAEYLNIDEDYLVTWTQSTPLTPVRFLTTQNHRINCLNHIQPELIPDTYDFTTLYFYMNFFATRPLPACAITSKSQKDSSSP